MCSYLRFAWFEFEINYAHFRYCMRVVSLCRFEILSEINQYAWRNFCFFSFFLFFTRRHTEFEECQFLCDRMQCLFSFHVAVTARLPFLMTLFFLIVLKARNITFGFTKTSIHFSASCIVCVVCMRENKMMSAYYPPLSQFLHC